MIWLHVGMPKTGSTALQTFLHRAGGETGLHYLHTGRRRPGHTRRVIAHNILATALNTGREEVFEGLRAAFRQELEQHAHRPCVMSSEMFFGRDLSPLHRHLFRHGDAPVTVIVYLRRFDDFMEADYKQRVRNRRFAGGVQAYVDSRLQALDADPDFLNFGAEFKRLQRSIPGATLHPRLYLQEEMVAGDVVADFIAALGLDRADFPAPPARRANRSFSRLASEALGVMAGAAGAGFDKKRHRRLFRRLHDTDDPLLFGRGDVLTLSERQEINDRLEDRNAAMRNACFPRRDRLFPQVSADDVAGGLPRGSLSELIRFQQIMQKILQLSA